MSREANCPYCGAEYKDLASEAEGENEGVAECDKCQKSFSYHIHWIPFYDTEKNACANGSPCKYKLADNKINALYQARCKECGKEEFLFRNECLKAGITEQELKEWKGFEQWI